jgi:hypothetical protein
MEQFLAPVAYLLTPNEDEYQRKLIEHYLHGIKKAEYFLEKPILPYKSSIGKMEINGQVISVKNIVHLGQIKLMISEMIALMKLKNIETMIYAGAAPGSHVKVLAYLFPSIKFHLFDPAEFDHQLTHYKNISLYKRIFTDDDIKKFAGIPNSLFVSDIRTGSVTDMTESEFDENFEECVKDDMLMQMRWVIELKMPALLKFRLPYIEKGGSDIIFEYLDGEIIVPPFGRPTSSETRLLVTYNEMKKYSCKEYEDSCYTHNFKRMFARYDFNPTIYKYERLCNCHDCVLFIQTLNDISDVVGIPTNSIIGHIVSLVHQQIKSYHMPYYKDKIDYDYLLAHAGDILKEREKRDAKYGKHKMPLAGRKLKQ